jgi:hypothetical protein
MVQVRQPALVKILPGNAQVHDAGEKRRQNPVDHPGVVKVDGD